MAAGDTAVEVLHRTPSPEMGRRRPSMDSKSPRSSKHHRSRSRSRSRDRKRKTTDRKHRRSRSRSKEARRRDPERPPKAPRPEDPSEREREGEKGRSDRVEGEKGRVERVERAEGEKERADREKGRERLSAENGEERHRRRDTRSCRGRSHSSSHERRNRSRSRDKRRSRSRSRDRKKKARSRSCSKHRPHRSRSRSKSRDRKKRSEKPSLKLSSRSLSPVTFRGRNTAMDAQEALARRLERAKKLQEQKEKELLEKQQQQQEIVAVAGPLLVDPVVAAAAAAGPSVLNVAALLATGTQVTPQIAMAAQMAALQARTLAETGIAVPSFYNPSAVNPMKFAEQEKKRKMLWQGKKEGDNKSQTAELWEKLNFGNKDQNVKFRKLMGIKGEEEGAVPGAIDEEGLRTLQQQEEMFRNLDVQYEMARSQTHTQRGMGLGFSSGFSAFSSRGMDTI